MIKKWFIVLIIIFIFSIPPLPTLKGEGATVPTVIITLDQHECFADVAPGDSGIVIFTGNVTCKMPSNETVEEVLVSLDGNIGGWSCSVKPSTMTFDRENATKKNFTATVRVPPGTSHVITQQLTIRGKAVNKPGGLQGQVFPVTAMISVKQFYNFSIECSESRFEVDMGSVVSFQFEMTNEGNGQDTIRVVIENADELGEAGFQLLMSQSEFIVDESSSSDVKITVNALKVFKNRTYKIDLLFYSYQAEQEGKTVEEHYTMYITITGEKKKDSPGWQAVLLISVIFIILMIGRSNRNKTPGRKVK